MLIYDSPAIGRSSHPNKNTVCMGVSELYRAPEYACGQYHNISIGYISRWRCLRDVRHRGQVVIREVRLRVVWDDGCVMMCRSGTSHKHWETDLEKLLWKNNYSCTCVYNTCVYVCTCTVKIEHAV